MPTTITIKKTICTYKELLDLHEKGKVTGAALEKAKEWLRDGATEGKFYEYEEDKWTEALEQIGFTNPEINYSGFWCQGDGASFTSGVDAEALIRFLSKAIRPKNCIEPAKGDPGGKEDFTRYVSYRLKKGFGGKTTNKAYRKLLKFVDDIHCNVVRTETRYYNEGTCDFQGDFQGDESLDALFDQFVKDAEELRYCLCKCIYEDYEAEHEYKSSDEAIEEDAEGNDFRFDTDGNYYRPRK
jgi:hypothetical protein